jgi:hypothetical protein
MESRVKGPSITGFWVTMTLRIYEGPVTAATLIEKIDVVIGPMIWMATVRTIVNYLEVYLEKHPNRWVNIQVGDCTLFAHIEILREFFTDNQ